MTQIHKRAINLPPFIQNLCFIAISWPISASDKYVTYLCVYSFVGLSVGLPLKSQLAAQSSREPHSNFSFRFQKNPSLSLHCLSWRHLLLFSLSHGPWKRIGWEIGSGGPQKGHPGPKTGSIRLEGPCGAEGKGGRGWTALQEKSRQGYSPGFALPPSQAACTEMPKSLTVSSSGTDGLQPFTGTS